jgi:putative intracellular protease/amidase
MNTGFDSASSVESWKASASKILASGGAVVLAAHQKSRLVASIRRGSLLVARPGIAEGRHLTGFHLASEHSNLAIRPIVEKYGATTCQSWSTAI